MPELLVEIGVEELPASMVKSAAEQLFSALSVRIAESELGGNEGIWMATPRRLIACVDSIAGKQPDKTIEKRGPAANAAFGPDGAALPPLNGFCKSLAIEPAEVEIRGDYVWANIDVRGKRAAVVLSQIIPEAIRTISFEKTMRWGAGKMRFSRPIRWLIALLDGEVVSFEMEGVKSGNLSYGHRFLAPASFEVKSFRDLEVRLRERFVEPDPAQRAAKIKSASESDDKDLIEENVYLTEWPIPVRGHFREDFLELPKPVLVTAMAKHEKFFPVLNATGRISNEFVSITNGGEPETVRRGNEWVLNARFNDAKFFFDEDRRHSLAEFLEKTQRILFQEKLGTVRMRAERISQLAATIASQALLPAEEIENCKLAGMYCKADLSTGLVNELPSLQGKIGGEYAKRENFPDAVCWAISSHYEPGMSPDCEGARAALIAMCADQSDRLAGFLGIGESPSGSSDPYGLRRAATLLIEAQIGWNAEKMGIATWILHATQLYRAQNIDLADESAILAQLRELLESRYAAILSDVPHDARQAAFETVWDERSDRFAMRARMIAALADDIRFVRTAKRPANIVQAAKKKGIHFGEVDESLFETDEEKTLFKDVRRFKGEIMQRPLDAQEDVAALRTLASPIDKFFDEVMVMVDDEVMRNNRLALLAEADALFRKIGDFSKIVIEGE